MNISKLTINCNPCNSNDDLFNDDRINKSNTFTKILPNLFLCGYSDVTIDNIILNKISKIINITLQNECESPMFIKKLNISYERIELKDASDEPFLEHLFPTLIKINEMINNGDIVLIYCRKKISRSASFIIAYLILYKNYTYEEAYSFVKEKRKISINIGFTLILQSLQNDL